jgi:hypothetical protein
MNASLVHRFAKGEDRTDNRGNMATLTVFLGSGKRAFYKVGRVRRLDVMLRRGLGLTTVTEAGA